VDMKRHEFKFARVKIAAKRKKKRPTRPKAGRRRTTTD
jgi:hypothetical protein